MKRVLFFQSKRMDGGVRTCIEVDNSEAWMHFAPGTGSDSSLLWYVRAEFKGMTLPEEPEAARQLFVEYAEQIIAGLTQIIELNQWFGGIYGRTLTDEVEVADGITLRVAFNSYLQLEPRLVIPSLIDLRDHWTEHLNKLDLITAMPAK